MSRSADPPAAGTGDGGCEASVPDRLEFASLTLRQPDDGYRFSIDSVLLADFASVLCAPDVLDLGTGCGVVLLLLARHCATLRRGVGVEIQPSLGSCAADNVVENGFSGRLEVISGDFRTRLDGVPAGSFGLVVSNPPFRRAGEGRQNPDAGRAIARHELTCTLPELFAAASKALSPGGHFALVTLASRVGDLFASAATSGIAPETLRFVHPFAGRPAGRVLFCGRKGGRNRDVEVRPPLVEYAAKGVYHPDIERVFAGMIRK
jgi:tRNA1Val (adenine37-N6)-methyltransferase